MAESTAERVAALLMAFNDPTRIGRERSVSELARSVGRERSQVSRMLKSLALSGLVEQDPSTRAYRLGWNFRVLSTYAGDYDLVRACQPVLRALSARTGEVALLSVLQDHSSLTVLREESAHQVRGGGWVGRRSPLYCTASGRALLFDASDEEIRRLTSQDIAEGLSPGGPATTEALISRIRTERRRGYAVASEEVEIGLTSVGAPIRGPLGTVVGVLNVSAPTSRILDKVEAAGKLVLTASRTAHNALGTRQRRS